MSFIYIQLVECRSNPVLDFPESVLTDEEPSVAMAAGDDEEGAISDPGSEIVDRESQKLQVMCELLNFFSYKCSHTLTSPKLKL